MSDVMHLEFVWIPVSDIFLDMIVVLVHGIEFDIRGDSHGLQGLVGVERAMELVPDIWILRLIDSCCSPGNTLAESLFEITVEGRAEFSSAEKSWDIQSIDIRGERRA